MQQESIDFLRKEAWRYNAKVALQQETIDLLRKEALRYNGFFIRILKLGLFDRLWFAFTRQLPESVFDINRE
jgi:hypothetical protein